MKNYFLFSILISLAVFNNCNSQDSLAKPAKVTLEEVNGRFRIFVNGNEFFIKGAGCEFGNIEALGEHGANSFRTWRTENGKNSAAEILDSAYKSGLMVLMGLEVGRERHGYDYNDTAWVRKQYEYLKNEVIKIKDHPALLGWVIGNELNLQAKNLKAFDAVNDISKMIHEIDTNHLTTTTLAGISKKDVAYINEHCSDIDFISIQMYADIINLQKRIKDSDWKGPYMITEWGATGHWEVATTSWSAPVEQTSKEKASVFMERYKQAIESDPVYCLGSYVFLWGQKQECTPTWYGMFLESGEETETVDAMHKIWTGSWPENRCPTIDTFLINGKSALENIIISKGDSFKAKVCAKDFENDSLAYLWEILPESTDKGIGGDYESRPPSVFKTIDTRNTDFKIPDIPGAYRLFVYVLDGNGNAATANIPFYIK